MGNYDHFGTRNYKTDRVETWGEIQSDDDVFKVFAAFCKGDNKQLPWSEQSKMAPESSPITSRLVHLNLNGYLTINSQPSINGLASETPEFGWGPAGGHVYQKAYLEFFCSPDKLEAFKKHLSKYPSISYMATDMSGKLNDSNLASDGKAWQLYRFRY